MKQTLTFLIGIFTLAGAWAQPGATSVNITVYGNKDLRIVIDNYQSDLRSASVSGNNTSFRVDNLEAGQHSLQITRTESRSGRPETINTVFMLRRRFDMQVRLNENGSLELIETKRTWGGNENRQPPMSNSNFNVLLKSVRDQASQSGKRSVVANAFNNTSNYFTCFQVEQLLQLISSENNRLQLAKLSYRGITDPGNFSQLYDLFNSEASIRELKEFVNDYGDTYDEKNPMSDTDFTRLYNDIKNQWPSSTQMTSLAAAFNNTANFFTVSQASQLIQLVSYETNRLQLCKYAYRGIVDPENFTQLNSLLNFQSSRDELADYVKNYKTGTSKLPMGDTEFNTLYQSVKNQYAGSARETAIANAFNNTSNFFTVSQASQLITLVNSESSRLQLCKYAYRSIVDPEYFTQLNSLLSFQSSRDELAEYVRMYNAGQSRNAMPDAEFNTLLQNIRNQYSSSAKENALTAAFNKSTNFFSVYQVSQLIALVNSESTRLQLCKLSYRSIVDPANFTQLNSLLSFQSSRDELAEYVRIYKTGQTTKMPMTDADFNTLYQSVQGKYFPGERMSSLTEIFNNTANYFTMVQIRQLVKLVTLESNKLQLAKLSYRGMTDRANYTGLYELFGSQASKDELDNYVRNYRD